MGYVRRILVEARVSLRWDYGGEILTAVIYVKKLQNLPAPLRGVMLGERINNLLEDSFVVYMMSPTHSLEEVYRHALGLTPASRLEVARRKDREGETIRDYRVCQRGKFAQNH